MKNGNGNGDRKVLYVRLLPQDRAALERVIAHETLRLGGKKKISLNQMVEKLIRDADANRTATPLPTPSEKAMEEADEPRRPASDSDRPPPAT